MTKFRSNHRHTLILLFTPVLFVFLIASTNQAFAMGDAPSTCTNRYDGPITSFIINNGTQTFDAIANPGVTFNENTYNNYGITFVIHTPNTSSQGNSDPGTTWYHDDTFAFGNGHCIPNRTTTTIDPNQNVTLHVTAGNPHQGSGGTVTYSFGTNVNGVSYNVNWIPVPHAPTNLSAIGITSSQIKLTWSSASSGSPVTNYKIYRSIGSGTETFLTTVGDVLSYNDTEVTSGVTYFYRVSAVNSYGESLLSNEASAVPPQPGDSYLIVRTLDSLNDPTYGYPVTLSQNGNTVATAYSPANFTINNGQTYSVTLGNINNFVFDHWQDTNSADGERTIATSESMTLTAAYRNTNSPPVSIKVGSNPTNISVNPVTNKAYVINLGSGSVSVIDGATSTVEATIPIGNYPEGIGVNSNTNKIYVSYDGSAVYVIDGSTNTVTETLPIARSCVTDLGCGGVGVNAITNRIYIANSGPNTVSVLDGSNDDVLATIPVGVDPSGIAVNPNTNKIYVADLSSDDISVIDGSTNSITGVIQLPQYDVPSLIDVNPSTNLIYVTTGTGGNNITVINGTTDAIIDTVSASYPLGIAVNPTTDLAYASDSNDYLVKVIGGKGNNLVFAMQDENYPQGIGINSATNRVYVADQFTGSVSVFDGSPSGTSSVPSAPQGFSAIAVSTSQINLSWNAPSSNGGTAVIGYKIERSVDGGTTWDAIAPNTENVDTIYSDTGLAQGATYTYRVSAINSVGTSSPSNTSSATTFTVPQSPMGLNATAISSSEIDLKWTSPTDDGGRPIDGYMVERSIDGGSTWSTIASNTGNTSTAYSDTGLERGTNYAYRVSAINSVGASQPSDVSSATTLFTITLTVKAQDALGNQISGIWMELHSANGATVATGYTPVTFEVEQGTQYTVYASNYLHYVFLHWDDGSLNHYRNITPTENETLTATYTP